MTNNNGNDNNYKTDDDLSAVALSTASTVDGQSETTGVARLLAALRKLNVEALSLAGELALAHRAQAEARRAYADLVAACRAGLLAVRDGDSQAWRFLADELPEAPAGHPLNPEHHAGVRGGAYE